MSRLYEIEDLQLLFYELLLDGGGIMYLVTEHSVLIVKLRREEKVIL